jgi:hypothetical protein
MSYRYGSCLSFHETCSAVVLGVGENKPCLTRPFHLPDRAPQVHDSVRRAENAIVQLLWSCTYMSLLYAMSSRQTSTRTTSVQLILLPFGHSLPMLCRSYAARHAICDIVPGRIWSSRRVLPYISSAARSAVHGYAAVLSSFCLWPESRGATRLVALYSAADDGPQL